VPVSKFGSVEDRGEEVSGHTRRDDPRQIWGDALAPPVPRTQASRGSHREARGRPVGLHADRYLPLRHVGVTPRSWAVPPGTCGGRVHRSIASTTRFQGMEAGSDCPTRGMDLDLHIRQGSVG